MVRFSKWECKICKKLDEMPYKLEELKLRMKIDKLKKKSSIRKMSAVHKETLLKR